MIAPYPKLQQGTSSIISFLNDYVWGAQEWEGNTNKSIIFFRVPLAHARALQMFVALEI